MPTKTTKATPAADLSALPGYPDIPRPGDIYMARLDFRLADGGRHSEHLPVMLYDVLPLTPGEDWRPELGRPIRIVWGRVTQERDGWMPGHAGSTGSVMHLHVVTTSGMDAMDQASDLGTVVTSTAVRISLLGRVGTYKPRDRQANSIEVLRDQAISEVTRLLSRDGDLVAAVTELAGADAERAAAEQKRDAVIRSAIGRGVKAAEIAQVTKLSIGRIYQIRDGRR